MNKGFALISAIVFSIIVAFVILTLYFLITRVFRATEELRVYTSIREAAASGARYGASMTNFPVEWEQNACATFNLEFRISGREGIGRTEIRVCMIGSSTLPGQEITGVAYEPVTGSSNSQLIFKITSISRFPANAPVQESRVEAVYVR